MSSKNGTVSNVKAIHLKQIVANTAQSRGMGALPTLNGMGYGLFDKLPEHEDKEPIWDMLMSPKAEIRKEAVELLQAHEGHIIDKAESIQETGQLQNVVAVEGKTQPNTFDIVAGMLRCVAIAYLHASDPKFPDTVEVKVLPRPKKDVDLIFMSLDENNNRKDESPIDRAVTYQRLKEEHKVKPDDIGKRQGRSGQSIRDHLKLLNPLLDDKRMAIHNGDLSVDAALKLLRKREGGDDSGDDSEKDKGKRARMHSVKKLTNAYRAKQKPEWMTQKEWEMFIASDVRKWLAFNLKLKFSEFAGEVLTEVSEEEEPKTKAKPKGKASFVYKLPRSLAVKLLAALGQNAEGWDDAKLKSKLEKITSIVEDGTVLEDEKLQGILKKLLDNFARGLEIVIKAPAEAAAA